MNICKVRTDVKHNRLMKRHASKRHSDECFFDVKPYEGDTLNDIIVSLKIFTHYDWYSPA